MFEYAEWLIKSVDIFSYTCYLKRSLYCMVEWCLYWCVEITVLSDMCSAVRRWKSGPTVGRLDIVVFGATGAQGGDVVRAMKNDDKFTLKAATRDPDSAKAKELVKQGNCYLTIVFNWF